MAAQASVVRQTLEMQMPFALVSVALETAALALHALKLLLTANSSMHASPDSVTAVLVRLAPNALATLTEFGLVLVNSVTEVLV